MVPRLTRSFCEVCETEFLPQTEDEDDIVCPSCNDDSAKHARTAWSDLREEQAKFRPGLLPRKIPHRATPEDFHRLLLKQGGRCAICGTQPVKGSLVVDHNHRTGQIRGLLCGDCNKGIGSLADHPTVLRRAAEYLEERGYYGVYPRPPEAVRTRK